MVEPSGNIAPFATAAVSALAVPDLVGVFGNITVPSTLVPGDKGKVPVVVTNQGDGSAVGRIGIEIYASSDGTLDGNDLLLARLSNQAVGLAPGKSKTYTASLVVPVTVAPGSYFLLASIDATNVVPESSENNNLAVTASSREVAWKFGSFAARRNVKLTVNDTQGKPVTFALTGNGVGEVVGGNAFTQVVLSGTDASTAVTITTAKGAETTVRDMVVHGSLKSLTAKTTDLSGDLAVDGSVATLVFDDAAGGHTLIMGASASPTATVAMTFDQVADMRIHSGTPLKSVTATEWQDSDGTPSDMIEAPRLDTLTIKGGREEKAGREL